MARLVPWTAAVLVVGAMVAPALADPPADGFPLSTYPMFATDRGDRAVFSTAVGLRATGEAVRLTPRLLAGADEPILAVRTANRAIDTDGAARWCAEVAGRVASVAGHSTDPIATIEVRRETHDVTATVVDGASPVAIEVYARCPVPDR